MSANEALGDLFLFWAKLDKNSSSLHPLFCHLVDVGAVTSEIWRSALPLLTRRRFARALGLDDAVAGQWVAFWAACHDLGKLSPPFQTQDPRMRSRLGASGFTSPIFRRGSPHGTVTTKVLPSILVSDFGLTTALASRVATVIGGHHGVFPRSIDVMDVDDEGRGRWERARRALVQALADTLGVPRPVPNGQIDNTAAMILAGLVSVADWIGSNIEFFPYAVADLTSTPTIDPVEYLVGARRQARDAITRLGWAAWSPSIDVRSFRRLFPRMIPNDLQEQVASLAGGIASPSLFIVEAPTGEGKTEAALYLADRWAAACGQRGCYIALPTQATSNQMFSRVRDFLAARYSDDVADLQLLHGHAGLSAEFRELQEHGDRLLRIQGVDGDGGADGAPAGVIAAEWFTHRKRGLLAPFGVGTIDQSLLAVLQTRHVFVRLFGLAHKTVIIDEVHAYDAYMSTLLERLLEWLAALGSSVVLLSATLPASRRDALSVAYQKGLGLAEPVTLPSVRYPRVTWLSATATGARQIGVSARSTKTVQLDWTDGGVPLDEHAPFPLAERLQTALAGGGCAVVICNTVQRAQQVYRALKRYFPGTADDGQPILDLLHARYLFLDRDRREKRALARFGKAGAEVTFPDGETRAVQRPDRAVLVATQIVEQSLDLDFDLMVTDLAPVDLVLQRLGRLYRHARQRPSGFDRPALWICRPEEVIEGVPAFDHGTANIYDGHVLLRSWLALKDRARIQIPGDVEDLIESVYDARACPGNATEALRQRWNGTGSDQASKIIQDQAMAALYRILPPTYPDDILEGLNRRLEEDDPEVHLSLQALTRLTDPTISLVLLTAEQLREISVTEPPGTTQIMWLLERSITVTGWGVVEALLEVDTPTGWRKSPLLRRHRLVTRDLDGTWHAGTYRLMLDDEVGLTMTKIKKGVK